MGQSSILSAKFDCLVERRQSFSLLSTAHDCETGLSNERLRITVVRDSGSDENGTHIGVFLNRYYIGRLK